MGLHPTIEQFILENTTQDLILGRILKQHKDKYLVWTQEDRIAEAELTGNLRYTAESPRDFPTVGDWVLMLPFGEAYIIRQLIPRYSLLERRAAGSQIEIQLIAANLDFAFVVQSLNRDFNLNRLERYLLMVKAGNITPIVLLNKADLNEKSENMAKINQIRQRIGEDIAIHLLSAQNGEGIEAWKNALKPGSTYCFLGSSGVGKSTLVNLLIQKDIQNTSEIGQTNQRGKHTTTGREMFRTNEGILLIDSPGMRELGLVLDEENLEQNFEHIGELAAQCKYSDCKHENEPGCAVQTALEKGELDAAMFENYRKMKREVENFSKSIAQKRKEGKAFGKMAKQIFKERKKRKY